MGISYDGSMLNAINNAKNYGRITIYRKFYYADRISDTNFIMLGDADDMRLECFDSIEELASSAINVGSKPERMIESILHFYCNYDLKRIMQESIKEKPLLFITAIHCTSNQRGSISKMLEEQNCCNDMRLWFFSCLDSASFIVLMNTESYTKGTMLLYNILEENPGSVFNTYVGCWNDDKLAQQWTEKNLRLTISFAQKSASSVKKFEKSVLHKCNAPVLCTGGYDRIYSFDEISGNEIYKIVKEMDDAEHLYYEKRLQLGITQQNNINEANYKLEIAKWQEALKDKINKFYKEGNQITKGMTGISKHIFIDMFCRLRYVLERIATTNNHSPLLKMVATSFDGFVKAYNNESRKNIIDSFYSVSDYLYEILRIHESTSLNMSLQSQTPGYSDVLRAGAANLIYQYYEFSNKISELLMSRDGRKNNYHYLLSPDEYPTVRIKTLFPTVTPPTTRLLVVGFPQQFLYYPHIFEPSLIHEIAHYAGDSLRMRWERGNLFAKAIAYFTASLLTPDEKADSNNEEYYRALYTYLKSYFVKALGIPGEKNESNPDPSNLYMHSIIYHLNNAVDMLANNDRLEEIILEMGIKKSFAEIEEEKSDLREKLTCRVSGEAKSLILQMEDICSEVYADVIAISMLQMNTRDYFDMLYYNCINNVFFSAPKAPPILLFERVRIVVKACKLKMEDCQESGYVNELYIAYKEWDCNKKNKRGLPREIEVAFEKYFKQIYKEAYEWWRNIEEKEFLAELREGYHKHNKTEEDNLGNS